MNTVVIPISNSTEASTSSGSQRSESTRLRDVAVIIPAHNEERSLPHVLGDLPAVGLVVVVDNASTDGTAEVARAGGATVVAEKRRGYGSACLAGLRHLAEQGFGERNPQAIVVFLDGDYSDHPDLLPLLVTPILDGAADFVLGSRLLGEREAGAMPPQSVWGNRLACFLMKLFWKANYTDLGPFRAIAWSALRSLRMEDTNFGWTVEMQIKAVVLRLRVVELPVPYRRRIGTSKISGTVSGTIRAGGKILWTIARHGFRVLRLRRTARGAATPESSGETAGATIDIFPEQSRAESRNGSD